MQSQWINQVRQLLARANDHREAGTRLVVVKPSNGAPCAPPADALPYPLQRKRLLAQIGLKARYYGLSEEIQAILYSLGHQVLQELDNDQFAALLEWLTQQADRADTACDSDLAPPAR